MILTKPEIFRDPREDEKTHREQYFNVRREDVPSIRGGWIKAEIRFDDRCRNGHDTFSITGDYYGTGGCIHGEIAEAFPELAPLIKWHLCSTDGPLHYVANTVYHVQQGRLDYARNSAIWPDATDEQLTVPPAELKAALLDRLPALMAEFKAAMESVGFTYLG